MNNSSDSLTLNVKQKTLDFTIPYNRFTFTIQAQEQINLPYYKGSTFRGGFGNVFKKIVCALKKYDCKECMLRSRCIYAYIFETSPGEDTEIMNMRRYEKIPHPFIIEPPEEKQKTYDPEEMLVFNLILIGKAIDSLPYFVYTFDELGKTGIGKGRGKYRLIKVETEKGTPAFGGHPGETGTECVIYSIPDKTIRSVPPEEILIPETFSPLREGIEGRGMVTLNFLTPARIAYQRHFVDDIPFHVLITSLLRRLNLLHYFHYQKTLPEWDHIQIINEAAKINTEKNALRWWDWERYSSRQDMKMKMGGVIGEITYRGDIEPFMPLLKAGEMLHVGKGTSFGLGKYEIQFKV